MVHISLKYHLNWKHLFLQLATFSMIQYWKNNVLDDGNEKNSTNKLESSAIENQNKDISSENN